MADDVDDPETTEQSDGETENAGGEEGASAPPSKFARLFGIFDHLPLPAKLRALGSRQRLVLGCGVGALMLAVVITPVLMMGGGQPKEVVISLGAPLVQHEFPTFLADLKPGRRRSSHVKMTMIVEIDGKDLARLTEEENAVMAAVTAHLRDQTRENLYGKEGTFRLRRELLDVINQEIAPARATSILFTEFLVD